jgi:hypothetical protein
LDQSSYIVVCQEVGTKDPEVAIGCLCVGQCVVCDVGNVVGADEWNLSILRGSEDAVHLGDSIDEARLNQIL